MPPHPRRCNESPAHGLSPSRLVDSTVVHSVPPRGKGRVQAGYPSDGRMGWAGAKRIRSAPPARKIRTRTKLVVVSIDTSRYQPKPEVSPQEAGRVEDGKKERAGQQETQRTGQAQSKTVSPTTVFSHRVEPESNRSY